MLHFKSKKKERKDKENGVGGVGKEMEGREETWVPHLCVAGSIYSSFLWPSSCPGPPLDWRM
jgi:hypothetical protein